MYSPSLDITLRVSAPIDVVWFAIVDPETRAKWWPELEFEPTSGAGIRGESVRPGKKKRRRSRGTIERLDDDARELHATWATKPGDFTSTFHLLVSQAKQKVKIRVIEEGFPGDKQYAEVVLAECRDGWRAQLSALADFLDNDANVASVAKARAKRKR